MPAVSYLFSDMRMDTIIPLNYCIPKAYNQKSVYPIAALWLAALWLYVKINIYTILQHYILTLS